MTAFCRLEVTFQEDEEAVWTRGPRTAQEDGETGVVPRTRVRQVEEATGVLFLTRVRHVETLGTVETRPEVPQADFTATLARELTFQVIVAAVDTLVATTAPTFQLDVKLAWA